MASQSDPVRFGIIGLGVGKSRVKQAATTAGRSWWRCVTCRRSWPKRRRRSTAATGIPTTAPYLERQDIDAVGIFTPSGTHGDLASRASRPASTRLRPSPWTFPRRKSTR